MKRAEDPIQRVTKADGQYRQEQRLQATPVIGEIITPPPALTVSYNGMVLDSKYLWIDEYWLQGHTRNARGHIISATQNRSGGSGDPAFASHNHDIDNDYTDSIIYTDTWQNGDKVLMVPIVGQDQKSVEQFVILCKLKRLDGN